MLFTSSVFLFYFLPFFLLAFRGLTRQNGLTTSARVFLVVSTLIFYGYPNLGYLIPFVVSVVLDVVWARAISSTERPGMRRFYLACSVLQNLSFFLVFKYCNWLATLFPSVEILVFLKKTFSDVNGQIPLPPGISFYLFESLSFVIDVYRRQVAPPRRLIDFLVFIAMFPRFVAGPIVRYKQLKDSLEQYRGTEIRRGLVVFGVGFVLKCLFADSFEKFVTGLWGGHSTLLETWGALLSYSFQLYLDFSGYSLMAIGLGVAIGVPFPDNFKEPYLASGVADFWRRWHISLSTWLRDYVYIPLGGSRCGGLRTYLNLLLTMFIGGIWHGPSTTFVIWGAYHGVLLIIERAFFARSVIFKNQVTTFFLAVLGWGVFKSNDLNEAYRLYGGLFNLREVGGSSLWGVCVQQKARFLLCILGVVWMFFGEPVVRKRWVQTEWSQSDFLGNSKWGWAIFLGVFLIALILNLSNDSVPFLYFQF